jgi:predicted enzyme related to lactoylglutathione lyase
MRCDLLCALAVTLALSTAAAAQSPTRPSEPFAANITWLYYKDVPAAMRFYADVLGLPLIVDQGWAKVYQISATGFVGLVDETRGMHRASDTKPVALAFVTDHVDAWYAWLVSKGVKMRSELRDSKTLPIRGFTAFDPEGYTLEFETFRDDPQNSKMRAILTPRK